MVTMMIVKMFPVIEVYETEDLFGGWILQSKVTVSIADSYRTLVYAVRFRLCGIDEHDPSWMRHINVTFDVFKWIHTCVHCASSKARAYHGKSQFLWCLRLQCSGAVNGIVVRHLSSTERLA